MSRFTSLRWQLVVLGSLVGACAFPTVTRAGFTIDYGFDNSKAEQTVGFPNQPDGVTVTGNTNPPHPFYDVYATSLMPGVPLQLLTVNGGNVLNSVSSNGITAIAFNPVFPDTYHWTYFDMQLDTLDKNLPIGTSGLTIKLFQGATQVATADLNFPWEGNKGENQHYMAFATGGDYFNRVEVYSTNAIQDIHNIDVATTVVPAPAAISLLASGGVFAGLGMFVRSVRRRKVVA